MTKSARHESPEMTTSVDYKVDWELFAVYTTATERLKDEVYLGRNINSWAVAAQKGAGAIMAGDMAKHDINNDRHTRGLTVVGAIR